VGPDYIAFEASPERDPDGSRLRDVLNAHYTLERVRFHRAVLFHWTAVLSLPVWLVALRPGWLSPEARRLLLVSWALSALLAAASAIRERWWRARLDSKAADIGAELPPVP